MPQSGAVSHVARGKNQGGYMAREWYNEECFHSLFGCGVNVTLHGVGIPYINRVQERDTDSTLAVGALPSFLISKMQQELAGPKERADALLPNRMGLGKGSGALVQN